MPKTKVNSSTAALLLPDLDLKPRRCAYRRCKAKFMPVHGHQKYCEEKHRIRENTLRHRDVLARARAIILEAKKAAAQ